MAVGGAAHVAGVEDAEDAEAGRTLVRGPVGVVAWCGCGYG